MPGMRRARWVYALILMIGLLSWGTLVAGSPDSGWPQFRGIERDGHSPEGSLARSWPESGPPVLWRKEIGEGFSEVVVADGKVFILSAEEDSEIAVCLEDPSGKEIWRATLGPRFDEVFGDGPRSTPTFDDGVVYALTSKGKLLALDAGDGSEIWVFDLVEMLGSKVPRRGFVSSPLIEGDILLIEAGGTEGKAFLALDKKTGETRWTVGEGGSGYSSGIAVTIDGVRQFVFSRTGGNEILSLLPSGEVHWSHEWKAGPIGTPVFVPPNRIFASAAEDVGSIVLEIRTVDGKAEVSEVWANRFLKNHFSSSLRVGDHIYGFDNATLRCIDAATGERRWAHRGFGKGTLIATDDLLIILSDTGILALVEATGEGYNELARFQALTGKTWTAPALSNGRLYLRDQDEMACLDLRGSAGMAASP